ncbi:MAG: tetratricopeptide repeat protein [Myxococcota bacterium]
MTAKRDLVRLGFLATLGLSSACASLTSGSSPRSGVETASPEVPPPPPPPPVARRSRSTSPQATAARALIGQAKKMLKSGSVDAALVRLERAASISPRDGEAHYWLSEAWLEKGNVTQAAEHHQLAARYLAGRSEWEVRLDRQASEIR